MRIRNRLLIHTGVPVVVVLALFLLLLVSLQRVQSAMEASRLAEEIVSKTFERSTFRNDYLYRSSDRAKQQWLSTSAGVGRLLESARQKHWKPEDRVVIDQLRDDHEAVFTLFSALVAGREQGQRTPLAAERESRLLTQIVMRSYDTVLHARQLQQASRENLHSVINLVWGTVIVVLGVMLATIITSSVFLNRLIGSRVLKLRQGTAAVGSGNLDHRIGLRGNDEFVELSDAFDGMTAKLRQSYLDLEREVAERKRAEEALRESEKRFRGIYENAAVGISLFDRDGRYMKANDRFCALLGYSEEELLGRLFSDLTHPEDLEPDRGRYVQLMQGESGSYEVEKRYLRKDGGAVWARVARSAQPDERGVPAYCIAVVMDVSARKEAEEELRKARDYLEERVQERTVELTRTLEELRLETDQRVRAVEELRGRDQMLIQQSRLAAMGEMLGNISHQWRQPLNVVGLLLQDLTRGYDRGRLDREMLEKNVGRARELIDHMSQTIDDFRNYLSPERAKGLFQVREVVEKAIALMGETLKDVRVEMADAGEPATVEGYRNEYAQVVMNILMNARDVFRERMVADPHLKLTISRSGERCILTIADNGGGIPEEIMDRIFDPYFTTKPPDRGTGIGLFMSRNIVENNMGGRLTVRNVGEGAEFRIECMKDEG
jgi:PAS domain S-box-containing protein